jgi:hypothetical protein
MYYPPKVDTQIFSVSPQIANQHILVLIPQSQIATNIWVRKSQIRKSKKFHKFLICGTYLRTAHLCKSLDVVCYPCTSRVCSG